jgi:hypothetical protein
MSLLLLIVAGLLIKSFVRLNNVDLGFDQNNLLTMEITLPPAKYEDGQSQVAFFQQAIEGIKALPKVQSVGAISDLPLLGGNSTVFQIEGRPVEQEKPLTEFRAINPNYFRTMKGASSPRVTIRMPLAWSSSMRHWRSAFSRARRFSGGELV